MTERPQGSAGTPEEEAADRQGAMPSFEAPSHTGAHAAPQPGTPTAAPQPAAPIPPAAPWSPPPFPQVSEAQPDASAPPSASGYPPASAYGYAPPPQNAPLMPPMQGGYPGADPYAAAPFGYAPQEHPQSTLALILGVVGLFVGGLTSPFAWYIAGRARKDVQAEPQRYGSPTMLTIAWVLGILGTLYLAFLVAIVIFMLVAVFVFAA